MTECKYELAEYNNRVITSNKTLTEEEIKPLINENKEKAAAEIQRLNNKIIELLGQNFKLQSTNTKSRCHKCIRELVCAKNLDNEGKCKFYKRDPKDGGYYG